MAVQATPIQASPAYVAAPGRITQLVRELPIVPGAILALLVLTAIFAPVLAPYDPTIPVPGAKISMPPMWMEGGSPNVILGTDRQGRDLLSRLIYGARVTLIVAVTGTAVAGGIGMFLGIMAGYFGGWLDTSIMRLTDAWLALPFLMFAIFLAALIGPGISNIVIVFGLIYWTRYARVIRVPNVMNTWMVLASLTVGVVIVTEASLSFLGLGVPPPTPAWGLMLAEARTTLLAGQWWLTIFPGVAISVVVLAANLLGDWLRIKLDPQQRNL
jgi:peptide/nickel transport system permease protein